MSKVDCSNVLNYIKEYNRMCGGMICSDCKLKDMHCSELDKITQEHINIVQKWSDEHPQITRREYFIKMCNENGFEKIIDNFLKFEPCEHGEKYCIGENCDECINFWESKVN